MVERISETSLTTALLMPHLMFAGACILLKYSMPSALRYVANRTYVTEVIALWIPVFKTVRLISVKTKAKINASNSNSSSNSSTKTSSTTTRRKLRGNVANRWLNKTSSSGKSSSGSNGAKNKDSKEKGLDYEEEASLLLRYWVVYGLIISALKALHLLPFVGFYLSSAVNTPAVVYSRYKWTSFLVPSPFFFFELKLLFFVWLRFLPKSAYKSPTMPTTTTTTKTSSSFKKRKHEFLSLSPVDMLYKKLAPMALYLADSSTSAVNQLNQQHYKDSNTSISSSVGSKLTSILDLAVLIKLISSSTKDTIVTIGSHSYALLPACMTLFMPSKFTSYGCIYASAVIPAANCAKCETSLGSTRQALLKGSAPYNQAKMDRIRFLKYWVIHALFLLLLDTLLYTILSWVPLSKHMTLIVWIGFSLPLGMTHKAYEYLEYEMVAFGVLDVEHIEKYDVQKTLTVRLLTRLSSSIPVAEEDDKSTDDNNKGGQISTDGSNINNHDDSKEDDDDDDNDDKQNNMEKVKKPSTIAKPKAKTNATSVSKTSASPIVPKKIATKSSSKTVSKPSATTSDSTTDPITVHSSTKPKTRNVTLKAKNNNNNLAITPKVTTSHKPTKQINGISPKSVNAQYTDLSIDST